jgi:GNAT superfamily N-acetyltransferase
MHTIEEWLPSNPRWSELVACIDSENQSRWVFNDYFEQFPRYFLVALHENQVVGFLMFFLQPIGPEADCTPLHIHGSWLIEAKIIGFGVRRTHRRQGLGQELQEYAIRRTRELGCYQIRSYSESHNVANYQLKLRLGFAAVPESRSDDKKGTYFIMPLRIQT